MVPELNPGAFDAVMNKWLAVAAGAVQLDPSKSRVVFAEMDRISGGRATTNQKQLAFVAYETFSSQDQFSAFLARSESLLDMLYDPGIQAHWGILGWVDFSRDSNSLVRPRTVLLHAAARCPLLKGAQRFELEEFDAIVRSRMTLGELESMQRERGNVGPSQ